MSTKMTTAVFIESDTDYASFEKLVFARVAAATGPLFTTDAEGLADAYLATIPEACRQHYNCRACLTFLDKYGGLVAIREDGRIDPALWGTWDGLPLVIPPFFVNAVVALSHKVSRAKVTGVFLSSEEVWGKPRTGEWTHLSGTPNYVYKDGKLVPAQ